MVSPGLAPFNNRGYLRESEPFAYQTILGEFG